ncbi:MAG TPA: hypothetical protein VGZ47_11555, partial [Gemmataceae bacterium]|nr:hypothetical protein [Gemmataceae bacterium]
MRLHHLLVLSIVATGFVTFPLRADEDQLPQDKAQPEVLGRGPIHEGFAQPYDGNPTPPSEVAPKKPPEPIPEQPPDVKPDGKNVQWMPGYWQWDTTKNDFIWVSGFWRDVPEGRRWVPGYWTQSDNGWLWVSGHWAAAADKDFQYVPQPPQSLDQGPSTPAPDDNSVYVPGNWVYETAGYAWRPGYWNAYRPGFTWVPANYIWTPYGWTFVSGYWDYDFFDRGLLFAPVYFGSDFGFYPGYFFRPFYTCFFHRHWPYNFGFGFDSLFVHRGFHHFFFGDFHGSQFAHAGFRPWSQFVTHHFDPIFAHERIAHRGDPHWLSDLNAHVQGRANGTLPAFPHTLAAQQASGARGSNVHAGLTSISQLQHSGVNLHTASAAEIRAQQQLGNHLTLQSQMWSRNSSQLHTHTPTGNVGNNVNVHPGISGSSRSFTPSPSAHGPISNERTPNYNILNNSFHEHTPSTTPGRSFTPPPSANLPHAGGTAPNINSNIPRSQSSSTPHWTQSPNTNLNPGWSRPQQTFAPNNSMAPRTPSSVPYSNWNTPPHTSFSNPGTTRVPTMTVPNYNSTPHTQSFSRPSFTPQPTMTAPNHNSMPHTQSFS